MMRAIAIIIVSTLLANPGFAQKVVEESAKVSPDQKIHLEFDFADNIILRSWDKNEVYVKATINLDDNKKNDKFSLNVDRTSGAMHIESEIEDLNEFTDECVTIIIRDGDTVVHNGRNITMDLDFEVFVPASNKLEVETINGSMNVSGIEGPMSLNTINGEIDLQLPQGHKADLEFSTINGTIYTNFDLPLSHTKNNVCKIGGNVSTKLNGGGPEIELETINGSIYLRRQ